MPRVDLDPASPVAMGGGLVSVPMPTSGGLMPTAQAQAQNPNAVIPNSDFTVIDRPKRKAVCLWFGDVETGKTTLGLKYTPQPALLIGFDGRSEYVEEAQKLAGYPVPSVQIPPPSVLQKSDNVRASATEALRKFFRNYDAAIAASKTGQARTIVFDTVTELGGVIALAVRGTLDNVSNDFGRSKDQINQIWWKIFAAARFTGNAHLVILGRASSVWENNAPTGDFKPKVADEVREAVDFSIHMRFGIGGIAALPVPAPGGLVPSSGLVSLIPVGTAIGALHPVSKETELVVKKAGNKREEKGNVYREADWGTDGPFVFTCCKLMPGSRPEDWK